MSLMEQFANPETMQSLSFGDKMAGTGITALMGMGTTFAILFLLWFIIAILSKIVGRVETAMEGNAPVAVKAENGAVSAEVGMSKITPVEANGGSASGADQEDPQLIAVIMAAIAAEEGPAVTVSNLKIRRIQRIAGQSPAWARAGRSEVIDSRRM